MNLFFLNYTLLLGLIATLIPLIIHLLFRKRFKTIAFPSLTFLRQSHKIQMRKLKLEQFLLMLLRIFIIIILVLAFAGPVLYNLPASFFKTHSQTLLVVVLDTSGSMQLTQFGKTIFNDGKEFLLHYTRNFSDRDQIIILSTDRNPVMLYNGKAHNLQNSLIEITVNDNNAYLGNSIQYGLEILRNAHITNKEMLIISDFQKHSLSEVVSDKQEDLKIYAHNFGKDIQTNLITNINIKSAELKSAEDLSKRTLMIELNNKFEKIATVDVEVKNPDRLLNQSITINPGASEVISVDVPIPPETVTHFEVVVNGDDWSMDNNLYYIYKPASQLNIPILTRNAQLKFLNLAIDPFPEQPGKSQYSTSTIEIFDLKNLQNKFIICVNPTDFSDSVTELSEYLNSGGSMLCFVGGSTNPELFNNSFSNIFGTSIVEVLNAAEKPLKINKVDYSFPPFSFMKKPENGSLRQVDYYQLVSFKDNKNTLGLAYSSESLIITTGKNDPGKVILFGFLPDRSMSNLPLKPIFLPFIHHLLEYKTQEFKVIDKVIFSINDAINIKVDEPNIDYVTLTGNNVNLNITDSIKHIESGTFVNIPELKLKGFYSLNYTANNNQKTKLFTVNYDEQELNTDYLSNQEIKRKVPRITLIDKLDFIDRKDSSDLTGRKDLTIILIVTALILLVSELAFSNYISREEKKSIINLEDTNPLK